MRSVVTRCEGWQIRRSPLWIGTHRVTYYGYPSPVRPRVKGPGAYPLMANHGDMSPEDFERLLQWLGSHRDVSNENYVRYHAHLSRWFYLQGCRRPEDLADEVWNRIMKSLRNQPEGLTDLFTKRPSTATPASKDPVPVLLGYSRNVLLEYWREEKRIDHEHDLGDDVSGGENTPSSEMRTLCLELCLKKLNDDDGQLLREYHKYEPGRKVEHRKAMAEARQSTLNALRLKVSRLMSNVRNCVKGCCRSRGLGEVQ
jgi:hypothetical protein